MNLKDFVSSKILTASKGSIGVWLIILLVIIASIYFVRGVFPDLEHIDLGDPRQVVIDEVQDEATGAARNALRLRTINFKACEQTAAVDFLLDITSSMRSTTPQGTTKIRALKDAVIAFSENLTDDSVIGVQSFYRRDRDVPSTNQFRNVIPIQLYGETKDDFAFFINGLTPEGFTPTHDALEFVLPILEAGVAEYPERQFAFIFVSDGEPVPPSQDPRLFTPDPSQQIKDLGISVYSIGILTQAQENSGQMRDLLTHIASSPQNVKISPEGEDLENIISQIAQDLCE